VTSPSLSLGPVLDLIERWQQAKPGSAETFDVLKALDEVDIPALRAVAEQHAAQLRKGVRWHPGTIGLSGPAIDAADFLCAPRREPEAE